ncbi:glutaredoxin 2 [Acinetobacter sp. MB5]|uniref:glutaredoxin 2 n=1 Tax=Acinetobacter sp. MB5 TaxID=2069438 RepID=UPI000DCF81AC|nr:glutaredoxin 2 [Acinetobacter sp. MB5]
MKLYIYEHCPFCLRTRMISGLKQLDMQYEVIMEGDAETPTRLVGKKVVPILQKQDGTHMTESLDIVRHLDQLAEPSYVQEVDAPKLEQWCKDSADAIYKLAVPRFTKGQFKEVETDKARAAFVARETKVFGDLDSLIANSDEYVSKINQKLLELEDLVDTREEVYLIDFKLFPLLRSLSIVKGLQFGNKVNNYMQDLADKAQVDLLFDQAI